MGYPSQEWQSADSSSCSFFSLVMGGVSMVVAGVVAGDLAECHEPM